MYKKAAGFLALLNMLVFVGVFCVTGIRANRIAAAPAFQMTSDRIGTAVDISGSRGSADGETSMMGMAALTASNQRVVKYELLEKEAEQTEPEREDILFAGQERKAGAQETTGTAETNGSIEASDALVYQLDEEEYNILLRIVEAEAGSEDEDGRVMVANVVFNRVNSEQFPDTVSEVVLQQSHGVAQFSPVSSGRIWSVTVSDKTVAAVQRVLEGEDLSEGALYFAARRYADSDSMRWFDEKLTFLFRHGGHEFFS